MEAVNPIAKWAFGKHQPKMDRGVATKTEKWMTIYLILFDTIWYYLVLFGSLMQFRRCKFGYFGILNSVIEMFWSSEAQLLLASAELEVSTVSTVSTPILRSAWRAVTNHESKRVEVPSFWTKFQTRHLNLEPVSGHAQMMSSTEHSIMINTTSIVCMVCASQPTVSICLLVVEIGGSRPVSSCSP